ncbi:MAG TPA: hypothetical protein DCR97_02065 [Deltaproteobacteria bacterium]|jgi:2-polyprenyl-6-hydroxyphenyl methylase/3-demethylubiquinone-9 3-methyltransferase|nr:hypothetical protein [Deltaproteobacteria bacterium]
MTIKAMQEWKGTSFVPRGVHNWGMFMKPNELAGLMARSGLVNKETRGAGARPQHGRELPEPVGAGRR